MSTARDSLSLSVPVPEYRTVAVGAWVFAVAFYAFGDTGSTIVSMQLGGIEDAVVAAWFYDVAGYLGLVVNKLLVVGVCWLAWRHYPSVGSVGPDPYRLVIPVLMGVRGVWLVANNVSVIAVLV